jgi:hypothetical protein
MGTGYTRNDSANSIADGNVVDAAALNGEFDALLAAFAAATGHTHSGSGAEGGVIVVVGPAQEYVAGAGDFSPKADSTYDLGKTAIRWATGYFDDLVLTNPLPVAQGGTGGTTASDALITLAALPLAGGAVTGVTTFAVSGTEVVGIAADGLSVGSNLIIPAAIGTAGQTLNVNAGATEAGWVNSLTAGVVTLTGGFDSTEQALGTITSGTVTPEVDSADEENFKVLTNNGAFTLAPPSTSSACCIRIHVINGASAGAITTSGFDSVLDSDDYATTNAKEYFFYIDHNSTRNILTIREIV